MTQDPAVTAVIPIRSWIPARPASGPRPPYDGPAARRVPRPPMAGRADGLRGAFGVFVRGVWLFPALVAVALVVLTAFSLNGSNSVELRGALYGDFGNHLIAGSPKQIRSDEWLVNTPMTIAQQAAGDPHVNQNLGAGLDMSIIYEVPYSDWSTLLRPQVWSYAVLPSGPAFAWKWWSLAAALVLSTYALVLLLLPRRRLLAASLGLGMLFQPFVQWWYLMGTLAPLAWGIASGAVFLWLLRAETRRQTWLRAAALAWTIAAFGVAIYPPFQVPIALVVAALCVGEVLVLLRAGSAAAVLRKVGAGVAGIAAGGVLVGLFLLTRSSVVQLFENTSYPGARVVPTGGYSLEQLFGGFFDAHLAEPGAARYDALTALGGNQTEASAFALFGFFVLGLALWLLVRGRLRGLPLNWTLVTLPLALAVMLADLFVSGLDGPAKLLLLVVVAAEMRRQEVRSVAWPVVAVSVLATFLIVLRTGHDIHVVDTFLTGTGVYIAGTAVLAAAFVGLWCLGRRGQTVAGLGLLAFTVYAGLPVQPLSQGIFSVTETPLGQAIQAVDAAHPGIWISTIGLPGNAVLEESGVHTWSVDYSYPSFPVWKDLDPTGEYHAVYNRYAHVLFTDVLKGAPLQNPQPDVVQAKFDACGTFAQQNVAHVLTNHRTGACTRLVQRIPVPLGTYYLYDIVPP